MESTEPQHACYYAGTVEGLSLDCGLAASGKAALRSASSDSAVLVGWFNSHTPVGAPPPNFLGILIEGPSRVGHYFRPVYGTSDEVKAVAQTGPIIKPDGTPHTWSLRYSPSANDGHGQVIVTLNEETVTLDLVSGARKGNAAFNRFGIVSWHRGGHALEIYLDNLAYSAAEL